jgi:hypothetical protein
VWTRHHTGPLPGRIALASNTLSVARVLSRPRRLGATPVPSSRGPPVFCLGAPRGVVAVRWSSATTSTSSRACAQWSTGPRHANACRSSSFSRFACTVHLQVARTCCDRDLGLNPLLITVSCVVVGSARGGDVFPSPPLLFVRCQLACRTAANAGASCGARVLASGRSGRGPTLTARTAPTHRASRCSVA